MKTEFTEAQKQMTDALRNFWPVTYPKINTIAYGPLMIAKFNEHLAPWRCQFVYEGDDWTAGDFKFESDEDRIQFLLTWGGEQP